MKTKPKRRAPDGTRLGRLGNLSRKFLRFSDGHQFAVTQIVCCVRKDRRSSRAPPGLCHRRGRPHRQGNYSKYPPLARRISLGSYIVGWRSVYHALQSNLQWTAPSVPMDSRECVGALRKVHRWTWGQCIGAFSRVHWEGVCGSYVPRSPSLHGQRLRRRVPQRGCRGGFIETALPRESKSPVFIYRPSHLKRKTRTVSGGSVSVSTPAETVCVDSATSSSSVATDGGRTFSRTV